MTINTQTNSQIYTGDGVNKTFPFAFPLPKAEYGYLYSVDVSGDLTPIPNTAYILAGVGNPLGGTVTYPSTGPALANGAQIMFSRLLPYTQELDIRNQTGFLPEVVEAGLDALEMQIQQLAGSSGSFVDKSYVDSQDSILQGLITQNASDIAGKADQSYVDAQNDLMMPLAGGDFTGPVTGLTPATSAQLSTKGYVDSKTVPGGGTVGQVLTKLSSTDQDVTWSTPAAGAGLPIGGTAGQVLIKQSSTNYDATWQTQGSVTGPGSSALGHVALFSDTTGTHLRDGGSAGLSVTAITDMQAILKANLPNLQVVRVLGYSSAGDGGGGLFYWDASSVAVVDGGTVFAAGEGGNGRWLRIWDLRQLDPRWFGVKFDANSASAAGNVTGWNSLIALINTGVLSTAVTVQMPPGNCRLNAQLTSVLRACTILGFAALTVLEMSATATGIGTIFQIGNLANRVTDDVIFRDFGMIFSNSASLDGTQVPIDWRNCVSGEMRNVNAAGGSGLARLGSAVDNTSGDKVTVADCDAVGYGPAGGAIVEIVGSKSSQVIGGKWTHTAPASANFRGLYVHPNAGGSGVLSCLFHGIEASFSLNDVSEIATFDGTGNTIGECTLIGCAFEHCRSAAVSVKVEASPGAQGRIRSLVFLGCRGEADDTGVALQLDNTGGQLFTGQWIGGKLQTKVGSALNTIGGKLGFVLTDAGLIDNGGSAARPAIQVDANCSQLRIKDNYVATSSEGVVCAFTYGIAVPGLAQAIMVNGNDFRQCTAGAFDTSGLISTTRQYFLHSGNWHALYNEGVAKMTTASTAVQTFISVALDVGRMTTFEYDVLWDEGGTNVGYQKIIATAKNISGAAVLVHSGTIYTSGVSPASIDTNGAFVRLRITPPNANSTKWSADITSRRSLAQ